jgi:hypothetical protein
MKSHCAADQHSALASIRRAPLLSQRQFLAGDVPPLLRPGEDVVSREAANVPDWYAPWARHFLPLADEFIAHATGCARFKRLPRGWWVHKPGDVFCRSIGRYRLSVIGSDHGWLIERNQVLDHDDEQVLTHSLLDAPVLCPTYATAARLAEASYPEPVERYILRWHDLMS